jgi:hypothetical protein
MDNLRELFENIQKKTAPLGFAHSCENLDVLVFEYTDYIAGFVDSYLSGQMVNVDDVSIDKSLDQKIETCLVKIRELQLYKQNFDNLAKTLSDNLRNNMQ